MLHERLSKFVQIKTELSIESQYIVLKMLCLDTKNLQFINNQIKLTQMTVFNNKLAHNNYSLPYLINHINEFRTYFNLLISTKSENILLIKENLIKYIAYTTIFISKTDLNEILANLFYITNSSLKSCRLNTQKTPYLTKTKIKQYNNLLLHFKQKKLSKYITINDIKTYLKLDTEIMIIKFYVYLLHNQNLSCNYNINHNISLINILTQQGLHFPKVITAKNKYKYVFGIPAYYLPFNLINEMIVGYFDKIKITENDALLINYNKRKRKIMRLYFTNFKIDSEFKTFILSLKLNPSKSYIIHGDLHLRNIIYTKNKFYLIDFCSIKRDLIERDIGTMGVEIYLRYDYICFKKYITKLKGSELYDKNILFFEILSRLYNLNKDVIITKDILIMINDWKRIYSTL